MSSSQKSDIELLVDFLVDKIQEAGEFSSLLADQYGNYFCQKLFQRLKDEHKMKLLMDLKKKSEEPKPKVSQIPVEEGQPPEMMTKFLKISQDSKGTHSLQVFLQNLESPENKTIISKMIVDENPLHFAYNKHATHVLIKYIEITTQNPYLNEIYEVIVNNFAQLSMDSNGLPLVKKCLAWIRTPQYKKVIN